MWGWDISWDMIENKDLLFACYSGKTPTGISEPLNSTVCCKWNCLLCSVRAGYSQLSLLTQLHENSPSCHPTLQCSLGPVLFPLKCWNKWSQDRSTISFLWIPMLLKSSGSVCKMETAGQTPRWCERKCDLHSPVNKGWPKCLGSAFAAAHPSKNQHIKTMEELKVNTRCRIWSLVGQTDKLSLTCLLCAPEASQPLTEDFSPDICKHVVVAGIRTHRYCRNLLGFINSPCSLIHTYHLGILVVFSF